MILDANTLPAQPALAADICIIGAGAAGITMAMELAGGNTEVLVLESGGLKAEAATQDLYRGAVVDERLHSPPDRYRQRRFGGTTTIWGGRCTPLDPIDFEQRDYMPHSGWPIGLDALTPYYPRANSLCEAGEFQYTLGAAFASPQRPMIDGFSSENFSTDTLERFSCPTDFGLRYGRRLREARNVRILLHANVIAVKLDAAGARVRGLTVRTLRGKAMEVSANQFVIATGGLEAARLLLANRDVHPNGIGNQHDVVGRYYMCHLAGTMGALTLHRPLAGVWNGYDVSAEGIYCRRRIALTAQAQRRLRVGNFICRLHHPRITDPAHRNAILSALYMAKFVIPYEYGKRLHGEERICWGAWLQHLRNVALGPFDAAAFAWHMLKDRKLAKRKFPSIIIKPKANLFSLDFHGEQQPNPSSRVTLGQEPDALGVPRICIDWRYTAIDIDTVGRAMALLADDLRRDGIGELKYDAASVESEITRYGAYGGHHIGTARMGNDPRESVVDANCRVHGVRNLFVAGTAVFPTSSQANPTLTVIALALRLAELLKREQLR